MVFTDPSYNVPIDGHVGGSGAIRHREFIMASGEMTREPCDARSQALRTCGSECPLRDSTETPQPIAVVERPDSDP